MADIGTDHGYLPVFLAQSGLARRIVASDSSAGSLGAARRSAAKRGVEGDITFIVAQGLDGVADMDIDTVVIAGMGGETISGILEDAPWTKSGVRLILQPQTKLGHLEDFLRENGYVIREMIMTHDRGRDYTVLLAEGEGQFEED